MGRRIFFLLSLLSLLLCLGTVVLWVRSYKLEDVIIRCRGDVSPPQPRNVGFGRGGGFGGGFGGGGPLRALLGESPQSPPADESFLYAGSSEQGHALWVIWSKGWWRSDGHLHWQSNYSSNQLILSDGQRASAYHGPGIASGKRGELWLVDNDRSLTGSYVVAVQLPLKWIFLATSLMPIAWLTRSLRRRWQHARRLRLGRCTRCSYDLTGNTSDICPECGTAVVGIAAQAKPKVAKRNLFTVASAISLLLCLVMVTLWFWSFRQEEIFQWVGQIDNIDPGRRMGGGVGEIWLAHTERIEWRVLAGRGRIWVFRFEYWFPDAAPIQSLPFDYTPTPGAGFRRTRPTVPEFWFDDSWSDRWFDFESESDTSRVLFPLALPAATAAILPLVWLASAIRNSRRPKP